METIFFFIASWKSVTKLSFVELAMALACNQDKMSDRGEEMSHAFCQLWFRTPRLSSGKIDSLCINSNVWRIDRLLITTLRIMNTSLSKSSLFSIFMPVAFLSDRLFI